MFDKDIEIQLDSFDFDEDDTMHDRESMGRLLTKQKYCTHDYFTIYKGDFPSGKRCSKCGDQIFD